MEIIVKCIAIYGTPSQLNKTCAQLLFEGKCSDVMPHGIAQLCLYDPKEVNEFKIDNTYRVIFQQEDTKCL